MNPRLLRRLYAAGLAGLVLFAPDDGTGSGTGTASDDGAATDPPATGSGSGDAPAGQTGTGTQGDATSSGSGSGSTAFTAEQQAHIDKLIAGATGKAKSAAEREFKAWLDTQSLSAEQQAQAAQQAAEQRASNAEQAVLATKVETRAERTALGLGVKPDRVDRFLRLVDLSDLEQLTADGKPDTDAIERLVEATLADVPEFKGATAGTSGQAGADFNSSNTGTKKWTRAEIAKLSTEDYAKHRDEIQAQLQAGAIPAA